MVIVHQHERIVHYRRGTRVRVLEPGRHRLRGLGHRLERVDVRLARLTVGPQEVPTADGVRVKAGAVVRYRVVDPAAWVEVAADPEALLHDAARLAVRELLAAVDLDDAAAGLPDVGVPASVAGVAAEVGIEVTAFRVVDVIVPAEIRRAAQSLHVARHEAQAALEQARGQSASVRNLANVAGVLDAHPALAALRLVEAASAAGATVVVERPTR